MLQKLNQMLDQAEQSNYAVIAPDFANLLMATTLIELAETLQAPLLLSYSPALRSGRELSSFRHYIATVLAAAEAASVPVGLHLDHATKLEDIKEAVDLGFTSVMIDASIETWEINVARTQAAVAIAHAAGVPVEAELGHVVTGVAYGGQETHDDHETLLTDPDQARQFVALTGIDALAVSIGTIHGRYRGQPQLQFDRLQKLHQQVPVPLVLHGSSGTGFDNIERAVDLGIRKINVYSAMVAAVREELAAEVHAAEIDLLGIAEAQRRAFRQAAMPYFEASGSIGKATTVQPDTAPEAAPIKKNRALDNIRLFLLDMDGTIYLGDKLLPGAREFLELLDARGVPYRILTNNSSRHRDQYAEKLQRLGLDIDREKIFTSGLATAVYLHKLKPQARVFLAGTPALEDEFRQHGFKLVADDPDYVVLGFDTTLTYEKLWRLCDFVRAGIPYIATHPDFNCPIEGGFMPDIGAMIAFIEASTGRSPDIVIGKPNKPIIEAVVEQTNVTVDDICMIGDRLYTDIALGASGITTILTLSGEAKPEDLPGAPQQPDFVVQDLAELTVLLRDRKEIDI